MEKLLIAPCGMNCGVCSGYLALANDIRKKGVRTTYCSGCRPRDKKCAFIKKRCDLVMSGKVQYCYECKDFPCHYLNSIDKRYVTLYRMSMVENLEYIQREGMDAFLVKETKKWRCPECGGVICCHNGICYNCGLEKLKNKKVLYRWDDG